MANQCDLIFCETLRKMDRRNPGHRAKMMYIGWVQESEDYGRLYQCLRSAVTRSVAQKHAIKKKGGPGLRKLE